MVSVSCFEEGHNNRHFIFASAEFSLPHSFAKEIAEIREINVSQSFMTKNLLLATN